MRHTITVDEILDFEVKQIIAGSCRREENKAMYFIANSSTPKGNIFRVVNHKEIIGNFINIEEAVDCYNSI